MNDGDDFIMLLAQGVCHHIRADGLSPFDFQGIGLLAVGSGYGMPALAKCAIYAGKHAFSGEIAHGGFLQAGA